MELPYWVIFGSAIGIIVTLLDPLRSGGLLGAVILGATGAVVGGMMSDLIFSSGAFSLTNPSTLIAMVTAFGIMLLSRTLRRL